MHETVYYLKSFFVRFGNDDDISWVINNHRQLVAEILEYYADKEKTSLATIKSRFNAITRIFRIAYETKNYELYTKYSSLVIFLCGIILWRIEIIFPKWV